MAPPATLAKLREIAETSHNGVQRAGLSLIKVVGVVLCPKAAVDVINGHDIRCLQD